MINISICSVIIHNLHINILLFILRVKFVLYLRLHGLNDLLRLNNPSNTINYNISILIDHLWPSYIQTFCLNVSNIWRLINLLGKVWPHYRGERTLHVINNWKGWLLLLYDSDIDIRFIYFMVCLKFMAGAWAENVVSSLKGTRRLEDWLIIVIQMIVLEVVVAWRLVFHVEPELERCTHLFLCKVLNLTIKMSQYLLWDEQSHSVIFTKLNLRWRVAFAFALDTTDEFRHESII